TPRRRRPGASGKGKPRGAGQRSPRPGTASKPKTVTPANGDGLEARDPTAAEPPPVDAAEPTPIDDAEVLSEGEDSTASPREVPMGHSPRRSRRAASGAKETVVPPDAEGRPIPIHLNGEVAVEPDPPEEAALRPIAGGD